MIQVRYFASLKDRLGRDGDTLPAAGIETVIDVWKKANAGEPLPDRVLYAVNMDYANADTPVIDGDEVAFFPPVTGG